MPAYFEHHFGQAQGCMPANCHIPIPNFEYSAITNPYYIQTWNFFAKKSIGDYSDEELLAELSKRMNTGKFVNPG